MVAGGPLEIGGGSLEVGWMVAGGWGRGQTGKEGADQGCIGMGGGTPLPPPGRPAYAQLLFL